jgi:transcriptional regulator with XRE-family HTH domain
VSEDCQDAGMSTSERAVDRARRIARTDRLRAGADIRDARVAAGLSLASVGRSARLSPSQVSRIERGMAPGVSVDRLAVLGSLVGLDVRLRAYPGGDPLRDAGQQRVLDRLVLRLATGSRLRREVTLGIDGDLRAWDGHIDPLVGADGMPVGLAVEVETRITDGQAFLRRLDRKMRDAGIDSVLVVVGDTPSNRAAVNAMQILGGPTFPIGARAALSALAAGRHPGGSALIFL